MPLVAISSSFSHYKIKESGFEFSWKDYSELKCATTNRFDFPVRYIHRAAAACIGSLGKSSGATATLLNASRPFPRKLEFSGKQS